MQIHTDSQPLDLGGIDVAGTTSLDPRLLERLRHFEVAS